jgi:hypothetical protein
MFCHRIVTQHDLLALLATHFVYDHIEGAPNRVQTSMYSVVAPRELLPVTARYATSMDFYTDGSSIERCAGFSTHQTEKGGFGYKLLSLAGIFTAENNASRKISHRNHPHQSVLRFK